MKSKWLVLLAIYIFLSAVVAYPHGAQLAYQVRHPVVFQVAEALEEAGWEEFEIALPYEVTITGPPIYWVRFAESTSHGLLNVGLLLGVGAPERAEATYEVIVTNEPNPDPGYAIVTVQLSDQAALVLLDLPERIEETARMIQNYNKPVEPTRIELWRILLRYGQTEVHLYHYLLASVRDAFLFLLEPGRRLLLAILLLLSLSTMSVVFQIWRIIIFLVPGTYLFMHCMKWVRSN